MDAKIVDAVQKKLEQQGVIRLLRLQLRAHVLNTLQTSQDENLNTLVPRLAQDENSRDNLLKHARDLLICLNLQETLSAFDKETGYINSPISLPANLLMSNEPTKKPEVKDTVIHDEKSIIPSSAKEYTTEDDSKLFEVSKDFSVSSSFLEEPSRPSPPRQHLAPATSFKPLGSSRTLVEPLEDSNDHIEVPEDDYEESFTQNEESGIAISSSFEPESPDSKSIYEPNASQLKSTSSSTIPLHSIVEVKSTLTTDDNAAKTTEDCRTSRATVRSFSGESFVRAAARSNQDDEYDFDNKGHEVSLKSANQDDDEEDEDGEDDDEDVDMDEKPLRFSSLRDQYKLSEGKITDAWSKPVTHLNFASNNERELTGSDDNHNPVDHDEEDEDNDDFDDYDVDGALAPSKSERLTTKPTVSLFQKTGSRLEDDDDDDEDEQKYKLTSKTIISAAKQSSSNVEDDYGDDFDEIEEVEEDEEMSVGKDESDNDDTFGGSSYFPSTVGHSAKNQANLPSKPTSAEQRLSAIERRMNQLEEEDDTGEISQIKSQKVFEHDSDEISIASENVDDMDFSVGDNNDPDSSTDSNLYSFLDNPTTKSKPLLSERRSESKRTSNLSNSGDFSMSENEIDTMASDSSYDFTTNAQPPDKRR